MHESVPGTFAPLTVLRQYGIESVAKAEAFLAQEPYTLAGLCEGRTIERLDRFIPHPDPDCLNRLLAAARVWIAEHGKSVGQSDP